MEGEKKRGAVDKVKDVAAEALKTAAGAAAAVVMTRAAEGALAFGKQTRPEQTRAPKTKQKKLAIRATARKARAKKASARRGSKRIGAKKKSARTGAKKKRL